MNRRQWVSVAGNDIAYLCRQFHNLETHRQRDTAYQVKILPRCKGVGWRPLEGVNGCVSFLVLLFISSSRTYSVGSWTVANQRGA